jgi:hypothetical protein
MLLTDGSKENKYDPQILDRATAPQPHRLDNQAQPSKETIDKQRRLR